MKIGLVEALLFRGDEIYEEQTGRTLARLCGYGTPAHGQLFAAAPALLAALENAVTQIEDATNDWPIRERHEPPAVTIERARGAIRAAKGEQ